MASIETPKAADSLLFIAPETQETNLWLQYIFVANEKMAHGGHGLVNDASSDSSTGQDFET